MKTFIHQKRIRVSGTFTVFIFIFFAISHSSSVQAESLKSMGESKYFPGHLALVSEEVKQQLELIDAGTPPLPELLPSDTVGKQSMAESVSTNTDAPKSEAVHEDSQSSTPSLFKKFTKILTSSFTVSPTRQIGSILSSVTGFFTDLFTDKPAVPKTIIPIKQSDSSSSSRDNVVVETNKETSNFSNADSVEPLATDINTQSSSSRSTFVVNTEKKAINQIEDSQPTIRQTIPSVTRSEVLNLIQQSKDNNQSLLNSLITAAKENSLSLNQSVSDLEKKISALQANTQRQLDKPGSTVSRTDADIQNVTNASITGATITTSSFSGTTGTFSGNFSGTTGSFSGLLTLNANLLMSASSYLNFGTTEGTTGYGFRDNGGTIQIKNSAGSWSNVPTSGTAQWTTNSNDIYYTTGNIGIGTTSPYAKLSVVGEIVSSYFTATSTTATSTFPYLAVTTRSNLGTVIGGTWNGSAIGDGYLTKSGDWTGTLDTYNGSDLLARANHTGTQGVSTLSNYDLSFASNYGVNNLTGSTTMPWWAQGGLNASSTSNFLYASTTAFTISGNSYLGTVSSGAWNGTAVATQYGGTGINSSALTGIAQIVSGTWSASSTLAVAYGGTGWNAIQSGYVPFGNGSAAIATSSSFYWDNGNSRLGIGTTTPDSKLTVFANADDSSIEFSSASGPTYKWTMGMDYSDAGKFKIASSTALGSIDRFTIDGNGYVGIGTSTPGRRLDVADSGTNIPQLRLSRESNIYTDFSVAQTTGDLALSLYGANANDVSLLAQNAISTGANLWVCEGTGCPDLTLADGGNIVVERDIKYPTSGRMKRTVVLTAAGAIIPTSAGATKTQVDGANSSYYVLDFGQTSTTSAFWQWTIPDSYDGGSISATYYWFTTVTSGGVSWCSQTNGVNTAEDINSALSSASCDTTSNNVPTGSANTLATTTQSSLTSNFTPGEAVTFKVSRGVDNTNDTAAAAGRLYMIKLEYGVSAESD